MLSVSMLNNSEIQEKLKNVDFIKGASPRWIFLGKVRNPQNTKINTSVTVLFLNTSQELAIGLGRDFPQRALKKNVFGGMNTTRL